MESTHGASQAASVDVDTLTCDIVTAIGDVTGTDPLTLPPLYDRLDIDALAEQLERWQRRGRYYERVVFAFESHLIEVEADGNVMVSQLPTGDSPAHIAELLAGTGSPTGNGQGEERRLSQYGADLTLAHDPTVAGAWIQSDHTLPVTE